ncbi:hypothetical protein Syun_001381 [Stephania yunnanensis]|uniref:Uncharacterized protein n=1 Tax=Stephania yunnanensis TaxID=152371 RepID=A0AAP0QAU9_9MAGN
MIWELDRRLAYLWNRKWCIFLGIYGSRRACTTDNERFQELENLSFMYTNAHDYATVKRRIAELYKEREKELVEVKKILMKTLENYKYLELMTVKTEVHSVFKEPYRLNTERPMVKFGEPSSNNEKY